MSDADLQQEFDRLLARIRQPARLTGGEYGAGPGFADAGNDLKVVLGFPDTYEIGISNQALQILYHLARQTRGVAVERTYLPWVDAIGEMRRAGIPLLTLETWTPLRDADLVALTLQHEFNYTNVLELLDLAGIPISRETRGMEDPLVIGGGPSTANFLPMAQFFDGFAVGDGEELFPDILRSLSEGKKRRLSRNELKEALSEVPGVFIPGINRTVTRRVLQQLEGAPYPADCLVPLTSGVHDRAWVEIMRGCTRGCRFCQAGMWYRPVRERGRAAIHAMASEQVESTGHQELALASLSTTDYSELEPLLTELAVAHPALRISLPSLRVDSAAVRLAAVASPTGPSLTLAPEAGSQRLRDVINKNVTETDILEAAGEAFRRGRTTLKLYFMVGLPSECDEDVVAIAELCLEIRRLGRAILGAKANRLQLNVSVTNFVPKPLTPFQWAQAADRAKLTRRHELLRSRLRRPGIRLALHGIDKTYLEAALARGDEGLGRVLERAWKNGARFDSWTEQFNFGAWSAAFASEGGSAEEFATGSLSLDAPLPWDLIEGTVSKAFLREEWERSLVRATTSDCRWDSCEDCGACADDLGNRLAGRSPARPKSEPRPAAPSLPVPYSAASPTMAPARDASRLAGAERDSVGPEATRLWRFVLTFSVEGRARYLGHLDRMELFRRAIRRAGGRLALSKGIRPKPLLALALPLGVGVEALQEYCEFQLEAEPQESLLGRIAAAMPSGVVPRSLVPYSGPSSVASRVRGSEYEVTIEWPGSSEEPLPEAEARWSQAADLFVGASALEVEDQREGRTRTRNLKQYVDRVFVRQLAHGQAIVSFRTMVTPLGTARAEHVAQTLGQLAGVRPTICRIVRVSIELA